MPGRVVVPVQPGFDWTFRDRNGLMGREMDRRAERVQNAAVRQAGLWKNRLKPSMRREWLTSTNPDRLSMRIGSNVRHALVHHQGAKRHVIRARTGKVLRYEKDGRVFFARSVNHPGHRGNPYLRDSLHLFVR